MVTPRVLLLAAIDSVGIARVPQLLARSGYQVSLLAPVKLAAHRSKFVYSHWMAEHSPAGVVAAAREHLCCGSHYDWVIFGDEPTLWAAVDEPERSLRDHFPFPLDKLPVLSSKIAFLAAAAAARLPLPRCEEGCDSRAVWTIAGRIGYPLLIKPERGLAGSGLLFVSDEGDLRTQLAARELPAPYVVQEAIPGDPGSTSVLYDHGRPVCWVSYLMRNTWPNRFASASLAEIYDHPDVETLVQGAGEITGFHGLAGIDWMRDQRTNRLLLLELNPRPTPTYHLGVHAGVDFAQALAALRAGRAAIQRPSASAAEIALFPQNLYRAVDMRSPREFFRSFHDVPRNDPRLVLSYLRRFLTHYFPASLRRTTHSLASRSITRSK